MRKKKLNVDIPKNSNAEITREHNLKNPIFNRTRIAALCLVLLIVLCIGGTLAYLTWTSNQTTNRTDLGTVEVEIVETNKVSGKTTQVDTSNTNAGEETTGNSEGGRDTKNVTVKSDDDDNRVEEVVRVMLMPELKSKQMKNANIDANIVSTGTWGSDVKGDSTNGYYVETEVLKLWLADDYADNWTYKNGAFYYKKVLKGNTTTPSLLKGVTLQNSVNKNDYESIKVRVVSEALQISPTEALDSWGIQITGTDDGTTDNRTVSKKESTT